MNRAGMIVVAVVVLVAIAGGAFYAGTKVGENRAVQDPTRLFQQRARGEGGQFQFPSGTPPAAGERGSPIMGGGTMGTIQEIQGDMLVLSTDDGTLRVQLTDTTLIEKTMTVEVGDLEVGEQVIASGSQNDDGSLTARSIRSMRGLQFAQPNQP